MPGFSQEQVSQVVAAVGRLYRGGLVEANDVSSHSGEGYLVRRLTPSGLREVGAWPEKRDELADRLIQVLQAQALQLERSDPERAGKVRAILGAVRELGTEFVAKVTAELIKGPGNT
jgi:hypothetical protein